MTITHLWEQSFVLYEGYGQWGFDSVELLLVSLGVPCTCEHVLGPV